MFAARGYGVSPGPNGRESPGHVHGKREWC